MSFDKQEIASKKMMLEPKIVPADLFPVKDAEIDEAWAARTIQYRSAFYQEEQIAVATQKHIDEWQKEATNLCNELRVIGTVKAEEHIIYLCNHVYHLLIPDENKIFTNMYQVIGLMSDRKFFSKNYNKFLDLLHMFQYGIFRCQFNGWAQDASNEWMKNKNITYGENTKTVMKHKKRGKGFVYKLLVSRASNTICVRLQKLTERMFGEYIIVRDKRNKKTACAENIIEHTFNINYRGYIVRFRNEDAYGKKTLSREDVVKINGFVLKALHKGIPIQDIFDILDKLSHNTTAGIVIQYLFDKFVNNNEN